jgi:signal transduction histidine kinase
MLDAETHTVSFWAIHGADNTALEGSKMPADRGIVGWVISHKEATLVEDAQKDERFFPAIDKQTNFVTRNILCAPLIVRGSHVVGAIQVLNRIDGEFDEEDLIFLSQFGHQAALALENARLYEEVQTRNKQLELLDSRKNEMMAVIAHEFRTPLNLIGSSADLLASGALNDSAMVDKMCSVLNSGVQRLTKLIAEIRNLSLSSNACLVIQKAPIAVGTLLNEVGEAFKGGASSRNISLAVDCSADNAIIIGDFALLAIALNNLVSNAIRFTPDGGCVTLRATTGAGLVVISVCDTGIGIEAEQIPLIFEKFYEVQSSLNHSSGNLQFRSGGLGLGLATVKAILRAHGTSCHVESTLSSGSTFSFTLAAAA